MGGAQTFEGDRQGSVFGASRPVEVAQERQTLTANDERFESMVDAAGKHEQGLSDVYVLLLFSRCGSGESSGAKQGCSLKRATCRDTIVVGA
jgi:hypothetical protein